jgi:hypothetical protein
VEHWRTALADAPGLRVGIVWQGSTQHKGDRQRSVRLARFAPLVAIPGITLLSLQKGFGREQLTDGTPFPIRGLGSQLADDFADTAALLANLDLVVAVDTAVVHLAGALGRPVWVVLPFAPTGAGCATATTRPGIPPCACSASRRAATGTPSSRAWPAPSPRRDHPCCARAERPLECGGLTPLWLIFFEDKAKAVSSHGHSKASRPIVARCRRLRLLFAPPRLR